MKFKLLLRKSFFNYLFPAFLLVLCICNSSEAANYYSRISGKWTDSKTWSNTSNGKPGQGIPSEFDTVYIERGRTVTIDTAYKASCAAIFLGTAQPGAATLQFCLNSSLSVSGSVQVGGTGGTVSDFAEGSIIFARGCEMYAKGAITLGAKDKMHTGSLDFTEGGLLKIGLNFSVNFAGYFKEGSGTIEYCGADQIVLPTTLLGAYNNLTLSGNGLKSTAGVRVDGTLSMEGNVTVSESIYFGLSALLKYKGSVPQVTGKEFGLLNGNMHTFNGSGGVEIENPEGVTLGSDCGVIHLLTLKKGYLSIGNHTLTLYGPAIAGTSANLKSTPESSLNFTSNSKDLQVPPGVTQLKSLTVISSSGITLTNNLEVGSLTLVGKISTGKYFIDCSFIDGAPGASHYIDGNIRHRFAPGNLSFTYPIGINESYTPVSVFFGSILTEGFLTVSIIPTMHPRIETSGLNIKETLPLYFNVSNSGINFTNGSITLPIVQAKSPGNLKTGKFVIREYNSGWTAPKVRERSTYSIKVSGIASFGDFVLGAIEPDAALSTLSPESLSLTADGSSNEVLTVTVKDRSGNYAGVGGETIVISKLSGIGTVSEVTDHGDGSYSAIVTSNTETGSGIFAATLNGSAVKSGGTNQSHCNLTYVLLNHSGNKSVFTLQGAPEKSNGNYTQRVTITAMDEEGNPLATGGAIVTVEKISGTGSISEVKDNGDGTYTAWITARLLSGKGVFSAAIGGQPVKNGSESTSLISVLY